MLISAINKFSLIEYPWEISCVVFTPWCNFRCAFCHNSEFVLVEKLKSVYKNIIPEKAVLNFLEKRRWSLTAVSICGWEPTLHKDLANFCKKIKDKWFLVKLDTNGRDPDMINFLIKNNLIDYIAMDIKHEIWKFSISAWLSLDEKPYLDSINILLNSNINYEFRTTVIKWVHNDNTIKSIAKYIKWAKNYYLQNYKWWNTLDPNFVWESFSQKELEKFKKISIKYVNNVWIRN